MISKKLLINSPAEGVLLLTLNRPECINALDHSLCELLDVALQDAAADDAVRCVIIHGSGERGFSAGYDVKELATLSGEALAQENVTRYEWMWRIAEHPKPIIVINHGICMGAGAIIAVSADIRLGSKDSIICFSSVAYGSAMLTWNLPQLVGWSKAKEYLMTGKKIAAAEAFEHGLLNQVTESNELLTAAIEMATTIASHPATGPQDVKRLMREGLVMDQRARLELEMKTLLTSQELSAQKGNAKNNIGQMFGHILDKDKNSVDKST